MREVRIAVSCDDPAVLVGVLAQALNIEFEARDSAYWGEYWTELPLRSSRVLYNKDPMHVAGKDPPSEFYFEADFSSHRTLVDFEDFDAFGHHVVATIMRQFADSRIVFDRIA